MKKTSLPLLLLALVVPAAANAACHWEWFCNGDGACKQMPLCDSVTDKPPSKPDSQPPAVPPIAMRPYKIAGPMGTLSLTPLGSEFGTFAAQPWPRAYRSVTTCC